MTPEERRAYSRRWHALNRMRRADYDARRWADAEIRARRLVQMREYAARRWRADEAVRVASLAGMPVAVIREQLRRL